MIGLVLHPGLELKYFQQREWEKEWIKNTDNLVYKVYLTQYEGKEDIIRANPGTPMEAVSHYLTLHIFQH